MSETLAAGSAATGAAAEIGETRIPRNVYALLREGYDRREKALDLLIAAFLAGVLIYLTRAWWRNLVPGLPDQGDAPTAGQHEPMQPNQNVGGAFPNGQKAMPRIYTYNMPPSRNLQYEIGPSATRPPDDPSEPPEFPITETC